jgi:protease secretion system outer membrane protein
MMHKQSGKLNVCMLAITRLAVIACISGCLSVKASSLESAIESALQKDPALRASELNHLGTKENIVVARSRLLPQISLQGSTSQLTQTTTQDLPTGGNTSRSFTGPSVNHQLVLRQALIKTKDLSSLRYAELQTEYMALKYKYEVDELKSRVVNAWIDVLGAQQIEQAYERPRLYMQSAAKQERLRFEQGEGTRDAALEAEAQYEYAKATHIQATETLKAKRSVFETLTSLSATDLVEKKLSLQIVSLLADTNKNTIWEGYLNRSLELQMLKVQELMQLERVTMSSADHKPTLDLLVAINLAQNDATSTQGYQYKNKQIGIQYVLPIYSGGGVSASERQASIAYEASINESKAFQLRLQNEFDNLWGTLIGTKEKQNASFRIYFSAKEQRDGAKRGVELGLKTVSEYAQYENALARKLAEVNSVTQDYFRLIFKINKSEFIKLIN